jgi:hypothetical protein
LFRWKDICRQLEGYILTNVINQKFYSNFFTRTNSKLWVNPPVTKSILHFSHIKFEAEYDKTGKPRTSCEAWGFPDIAFYIEYNYSLPARKSLR